MGKTKTRKKPKRASFLKPRTKYRRSFANMPIFWIHWYTGSACRTRT